MFRTSHKAGLIGSMSWWMLLMMVLSLLPILSASTAPVATAASATADTPPDRSRIITATDARRYAQDLISLEVDLGAIPAWRDAHAGPAVAHYDLASAITAYVVAVTDHADRAIGYIVVSAPVISNPVLEFAESAPPYLAGLKDARDIAAEEGSTLIETHPLYLGPLSHFYELVLPATSTVRRIINVDTGEVQSVTPDQVPATVSQQVSSTQPAPRTATAPALQTIKQIGSVPDYKQFQTTYGGRTCKSGCAPTATASIMAYWANNGYPNLFDGNDQGLVKDLGTRMGTYCGGVYGWSDIGNVATAVHNLAATKGYTFNSRLIYPWDATFSMYQASIDEGYPLVVHLVYRNAYYNHTVAGMGYQTSGNFMIVRDNLRSTSTRYVSYTGQQVYFNTIRPVATIAVGQGSSRQATFQRAYDATRQGTTTNITYGVPVAPTEFYQPDGWPNGKSAVVRQRFSNDVWLIHDEDSDKPNFSIPAYPIYGAIKSYWEANGWLGEPTTSPYRNAGGQLEQHFRFGYVISGGTPETTWATRWPSAQACTNQGLWRLEVTNLLDLGDTRWPPDQNLTAGPSTVVCVDMNKPGYALYHDVGVYEATNPQNQTGDAQGAWGDHWFARITGTITNLPSHGFYRVSAACDDGCDIQIKSATYAGWTQRITSWRDQPAMHLGSMWAQKGDQVDITWYEHTGLARVWLKIGSSALTLPPLATQCDARIKLANGAPVTNRVTTPLTISAPDAAEMKISHREDMSDATWQPYAPSLEWELVPANEVVTRTVYAQFRDASEQTLCQGAILSDDIVLDTLAPTGTAAIQSSDALTVTLLLDGRDQPEGSGVDAVMIRPITPDNPMTDIAELPENAWQPYSTPMTIFKPMTSVAMTQLAYQVWFRDAAGNVSESIIITEPQVEDPPQDEQPRQIYLPLVIR